LGVGERFGRWRPVLTPTENQKVSISVDTLVVCDSGGKRTEEREGTHPENLQWRRTLNLVGGRSAGAGANHHRSDQKKRDGLFGAHPDSKLGRTL